MHRFMNSFEALLSIHFLVKLVKCRNIILPTAMTTHEKQNHSSVQFFPCLTLSWHTLIIFMIYIIKTKLDFVSFDDKNLQRRRKFVGERDSAPYKTLILVRFNV